MNKTGKIVHQTVQPLYLQVRDYLIKEAEGQQEYRFPPERELCKLLNVSRPTVRKALNYFIEQDMVVRYPGRGTFLVNSTARTGKSSSLKLIIRQDWQVWSHDNYFGSVFNGILSAAGNCSITTEKYSDKLKHDIMVESNSLSPTLWLSPEGTEIEALKELSDHGHTGIVINRVVDYPRVYSVFTDQEYGVHLAVDCFLKNGHRQVQYIGTESDQLFNDNLYRCLSNKLKELNASAPLSPIIVKNEMLRPDLQRKLKNVLEKVDSSPALLMSNGKIQKVIIDILCEWKLRIPQDVSLISYDNMEDISERYGISVIRQNLMSLGETAFNIYNQLVNGKQARKMTAVKPEFVQRTSILNLTEAS